MECELRLLAQVAPEEALRVLSSKEMLWSYIKNVIFNMQIMVPNSVMPEKMRAVEQAPAAPTTSAAPAPQKKSREERLAERRAKDLERAKKRAEDAERARKARKAQEAQKDPESAEKPGA